MNCYCCFAEKFCFSQSRVDENWVDFRVPWDVPIIKVEDYRYELEECIRRLRKRNKKQKWRVWRLLTFLSTTRCFNETTFQNFSSFHSLSFLFILHFLSSSRRFFPFRLTQRLELCLLDLLFLRLKQNVTNHSRIYCKGSWSRFDVGFFAWHWIWKVLEKLDPSCS